MGKQPQWLDDNYRECEVVCPWCQSLRHRTVRYGLESKVECGACGNTYVVAWPTLHTVKVGDG